MKDMVDEEVGGESGACLSPVTEGCGASESNLDKLFMGPVPNCLVLCLGAGEREDVDDDEEEEDEVGGDEDTCSATELFFCCCDGDL